MKPLPIIPTPSLPFVMRRRLTQITFAADRRRLTQTRMDADRLSGSVATTFFPAEGPARGAVVFAHGAGAGQRHPFMTAVAKGLARRGWHVLTFDFPYMQAGRKAPDRPEVLEESIAGAVRALKDRSEVTPKLPVFAGGKSMGGRIASQAAARGLLPDVNGLFFLGYPLHPPGKPQQLRDKHLPDVRIPMLFVQGSRDAFGTPEELRPVLDRLGDRAELFEIKGGDHSFVVPKSAGSRDQILESVLERLVGWMKSRT
jgi:predicted alpha/beta-hydrolase family hydrolase